MIALLLPHTGAHAAQHAPLLACLPPIFRRAVATVRRKPLVPAGLRAAAVLRAAGTATTLLADAEPVMRNRMIADVRAETEARQRAARHADLMHAGYARSVDRLRQEAGLPTVEEMRDEYFGLPKREPMRREPGKPPWHTAQMPVYGQAPVADVLAAEQEGRRVA